jgi:hypothetical protein
VDLLVNLDQREHQDQLEPQEQ